VTRRIAAAAALVSCVLYVLYLGLAPDEAPAPSADSSSQVADLEAYASEAGRWEPKDALADAPLPGSLGLDPKEVDLAKVLAKEPEAEKEKEAKRLAALALSPVPEPGPALLVALGLGALGHRQRARSASQRAATSRGARPR
jgi:hypothetical protein